MKVIRDACNQPHLNFVNIYMDGMARKSVYNLFFLIILGELAGNHNTSYSYNRVPKR